MWDKLLESVKRFHVECYQHLTLGFSVRLCFIFLVIQIRLQYLKGFIRKFKNKKVRIIEVSSDHCTIFCDLLNKKSSNSKIRDKMWMKTCKPKLDELFPKDHMSSHWSIINENCSQYDSIILIFLCFVTVLSDDPVCNA